MGSSQPLAGSAGAAARPWRPLLKLQPGPGSMLQLQPNCCCCHYNYIMKTMDLVVLLTTVYGLDYKYRTTCFPCGGLTLQEVSRSSKVVLLR